MESECRAKQDTQTDSVVLEGVDSQIVISLVPNHLAICTPTYYFVCSYSLQLPSCFEYLLRNRLCSERSPGEITIQHLTSSSYIFPKSKESIHVISFSCNQVLVQPIRDRRAEITLCIDLQVTFLDDRGSREDEKSKYVCVTIFLADNSERGQPFSL